MANVCFIVYLDSMAVKKIRTNFFLDQEHFDALDELRRAEKGPLISRSEIVRRLIMKALEAKRRAEKSK